MAAHHPPAVCHPLPKMVAAACAGLNSIQRRDSRATTVLIQELVDQAARAERGLPPVDVWAGVNLVEACSPTTS